MLQRLIKKFTIALYSLFHFYVMLVQNILVIVHDLIFHAVPLVLRNCKFKFPSLATIVYMY